MLRKRKPTSEFGRLAEDFAVKLLISKGYKILERNFRSRFGEIDIVALEGDTLVFAEVKARWSNSFGAPEEAVTPKKLWKIGKTGEYFLLCNPKLPKKLRIDVIALEMEGGKIKSARIISAT